MWEKGEEGVSQDTSASQDQLRQTAKGARDTEKNGVEVLFFEVVGLEKTSTGSYEWEWRGREQEVRKDKWKRG